MKHNRFWKNTKLTIMLFAMGIPLLSGCDKPPEPSPVQEISSSTPSSEKSVSSNIDKLSSANLHELVAFPDSIMYYNDGGVYDASDKVDLIHREIIASFGKIMDEYTIANIEGEETEKAVASGTVLEFKYEEPVDICWLPYRERRSEYDYDEETRAFFENELKNLTMEFSYNRIIFVLKGGESTVEGMLFIGDSYNAIGKINPTDSLMTALNDIENSD